ncbi:hypothetical protein ACHAW5_004578 [Stephanodiscus triporus]|uniref:Orc1-like AAA ATPase domain-containing protein n=1 Tax=Stephanodiscus triporus TaxID=2934178 RepID=A0ABD3NXY6_9STRA
MTTPNRNDVLFGRGFAIGIHPGNQHLRDIVRARKLSFDVAKKKEKRMIARQIVEEIQKLDPPGRFLIEDPNQPVSKDDENASEDIMYKTWVVVEVEKAIDKVMHRLREREKVAASDQDPTGPTQRRKREKSLVVDGGRLSKNSIQIFHAGGVTENCHDNDVLLQQQQEQPLSSDGWTSFLQSAQRIIYGDIQSSEIEPARNVVDHQHASYGHDMEDIGHLGKEPSNQNHAFHQHGVGLNCSGQINLRQMNNRQIGCNLQEVNAQQVEATRTILDCKDIGNIFDHFEEQLQSGADDIGEGLDSFFHGCDNDFGDFANKDRNANSIALQLHNELPLRVWIERSKVATIFAPGEYARLALSVALKLTEYLIETDSEEVRTGCGAGIPIPLTGIVVENVFLTTKETVDAASGWEGGGGDALVRETIDFVWMKHIAEECSATGGVMNRLFRLGVIFYELFSEGDKVLTPLNEEAEASPHHVDRFKLSIDSTDMVDDNDESYCRKQDNNSIHQSRPVKKSQRQTSRTINMYECFVAKLASLGIPYSLRFLIKSLLECGQGNLCGDDAFRSFVEVKLDLELMLNEPTRFLDDIVMTDRIPSLIICDKLYGREHEIETVESSYEQLKDGACSGIVIMGEAGVGKSLLAMHIRELTIRAGGYFLGAKFDQNNHVNPLSMVGLVFNSLCDMFARDATPSQLNSVGEALGIRLGSQAFRLTALLPSLSKLLLPTGNCPSGSACVDYALSTRFLFTELLHVISAHSMRPITIFFDDVHFAVCDSTTLSLLESLISSIQGSKSIFFTCCYRDNQVDDTRSLDRWLSVIVGFSLSTIKLRNLTFDGVNNLLSDMLCLTPRITRPLASVLTNMTRGNCLFVRQLLESLKDQGLIYFNLSNPGWAWDLDKVMDLEITNDVVLLLIEEMRRLPAELQLGLRIASCLGSCVKYSVLDILSRDLGVNLLDSLRRVSEKGFMKHNSGVSSFSFVHDKIQQAAKEMMLEQERLQLHMQLGLAICSYTLDNEQNDDLFFMSVNQINCGGKGVLSDPSQTTTIAALNLKAGKLAITYSDYNAALKLFEHGISFLESDHWHSLYAFSIDLFDLATEAACIINNGRAVRLYADQILKHARCFNDTLNCLYSTTKALRQANRLHQSMQSTFHIIKKCGEVMPRAIDEKLMKDLQIMDATLKGMSDESILSIGQTMDQRTIFLMKLYAELANLLHFVNPSLVAAVSLRLADLTLKNGLSLLSPLAFVHFGSVLVNLGDEYIMDGCRVALWATVPLQAVADAHRQGHKFGERSGDYLYSTMNNYANIFMKYFAGEDLSTLRKEIHDFFLKMRGPSNESFVGWGNMSLLHLQFVTLQDGEECLNEERVDDIPGQRAVVGDLGKPDVSVLLLDKILSVQRLFSFGRFDDITFDDINISEEMSEKKHFLRPNLLMGIFFEGLVAFQCARRQRNDSSKEKWVHIGESVLKRMRCFSDHSLWNWENKYLLLLAEKMYTDGNFDQAASCYDSALQSANEHRFTHEEAITCELAGDFYYERNFRQKSLAFFKHSIECYTEWGAFAVARRLESSLGIRFGSDIAQLAVPNNNCLEAILSSRRGSSKKRQVG